MKAQWKKRRYSWELNTGTLRINILDGHVDYPGQWIMNCYPQIVLDNTILHVDTLEDAQQRAVELVRDALQDILEALPQ